MAELEAIHQRLTDLLAESGAHLDAIYYCPHHPEPGIAGERPEYKIRCHCRKPAPGLLEAAARDLSVDLSRSWMVGDSERDLGAAAALGVKSALVASNQANFKGDILSEHNFRSNTVLEAVQRILIDFPHRKPLRADTI